MQTDTVVEPWQPHLRGGGDDAGYESSATRSSPLEWSSDAAAFALSLSPMSTRADDEATKDDDEDEDDDNSSEDDDDDDDDDNDAKAIESRRGDHTSHSPDVRLTPPTVCKLSSSSLSSSSP